MPSESNAEEHSQSRVDEIDKVGFRLSSNRLDYDKFFAPVVYYMTKY